MIVKRRTTMMDIAKSAGVSHTTVSNVLNRTGREDQVSEARARIIRRLALKKGYVPNRMARGLKTGKTYTIMLVTSSGLHYPYVYEMIEHIQSNLALHDYHLQLDLRQHVKDYSAFYRKLPSGPCDGVIFHGYVKVPNSDVKRLVSMRRNGMPLVVAFASHPGELDCVDYDRIKAIELAVRHLAGQGHRHVAMVTSSGEISKNAHRLQVYRTLCRTMNITADAGFILPWEVDEDTLPLWDQIRALRPSPTAILTHNEEVAMSLLRHIRQSGLRVPEDIAIITHGNFRHIRFADVPLTAVDSNQKEIAKKTVDLLMAQIQNPKTKPRQEIVEPFLVVRQSSNFQRN